MKVLMLVNWKVNYCKQEPDHLQPPDYVAEGQPYWFFRYFKENPHVDVVDISSCALLEKFEKNHLRFYIWQTIRVLPKLDQYDIIISHGMQSAVVLSLWRRMMKTKAKHIVFDIGSFNSAAEHGISLKLMQFASKSIDGVIYHTSSQRDYYQKFFPWIVPKSRFVRFGTDVDFFDPRELAEIANQNDYIICVGYIKRDWDTLVAAYQKMNTTVKLRLVGHVEEKYNGIPGVDQCAFVPIKELIKQIHNACFAVLPLESFNYSYGQMTLMQQMALGKCVVAARVPSLVDYIDDTTAVLYTPGDAKELAEKLTWAIENPKEREIIAQAGKRYLKEHCNERIMAEDIERSIATFINH